MLIANTVLKGFQKVAKQVYWCQMSSKVAKIDNFGNKIAKLTTLLQSRSHKAINRYEQNQQVYIGRSRFLKTPTTQTILTVTITKHTA